MCYYCDEKYSPSHKCKEKNFIQTDKNENISSDEAPLVEVSREDEVEPQDTTTDTTITPNQLIISLHELVDIYSP